MSELKSQGQETPKSGLWGGRFEKEMDRDVLEFSSSLDLDRRLWRADLAGSVAHARMLGRQSIISQTEAEQIISGLQQIGREIEAGLTSGREPFSSQAEDIHSEIERKLRELIGPVAGKLHTARSRNDQVATAFRMTLCEGSLAIDHDLKRLQKWILQKANDETETILPGLTHFQHAQPVSLAHHLLSYFWMLDRDRERLTDFRTRAMILPLGSAALAGTSFPVDREQVARELGFSGICENSLDGVSDRDFVIEFLAASSMVMMHLSRWCEELIIWSAPEHGFVELDETMTTGSSIMPQKKNPDIAELIRGRTGRAYGALMGALTMMKSLPLSYNRDLQEDKFHAFQGLDVVVSSLRVFCPMLETADFNRERMAESLRGDFSNATDLADDLARKGLPFREAHEVVGKVVRFCLKEALTLEDLSLEQLKPFHPLIDETSRTVLSHDGVMRARTSRGGTAPSAVLAQIERARQKL